MEAFRTAFTQALADPELVGEGARQNLIIDAMSRAELESRIRVLYEQKPEVNAKVRKAMEMQ